MIFYTALDSQGHTHWETTQADARAVNKNFEKVDVPVDKPGLHVWLNATQQTIDELRDQIAEGGEGLPEEAEPTPQLRELVQANPPWPAGPPIGDNPELPDEDEDVFNAKILEDQVNALGMLGHEALDRFDGWSEITGISAAFARGVALLNVIASDQHQIARLFLRDRLKKRRRFG